MIKFFRNIRQNLVVENQHTGSGRKGRLGKYLGYALGEIFLVVVGILIALQINTWNNRQILSKTEQNILKDLKVEIATNIKELDNVILINKNARQDAQKILSFYAEPRLIEDLSEDSLFQMTWNLPGVIFQAETGILNSIISSGQIGTIKNRNLKYKLASLNDVVTKKTAYSKTVRKLGNEYFDKAIYPKLTPTIQDGIMARSNFKEAFGIPEFHLVLRGTYYQRRGEAIQEEEELKTFLEEVLTLIDQEIEV